MGQSKQEHIEAGLPTHAARKDYTMILTTFLGIAIIWTAAVFFIGKSTVIHEKDNVSELIENRARSFFQLIVTTRAWNASLGGVYVEESEKTLPNPYLDVPHRDVTTDADQHLTLINPAYMTRMIAEYAVSRNQVQFHITSLKPIRPLNEPDPWEKKALQKFDRGESEYSEWVNMGNEEELFRYMAPLITEKACLKCHAKQGYKEGDIRGGISVSIPVSEIMANRDRATNHILFSFTGIWIFGMIGIGIAYLKTARGFKVQEESNHALKKALDEIITLKGLIPICSSCKKVMNDSGHWEQIELYIRDHSEADFTHGICPDCLAKLYPDYLDNTGKSDPSASDQDS